MLHNVFRKLWPDTFEFLRRAANLWAEDNDVGGVPLPLQRFFQFAIAEQRHSKRSKLLLAFHVVGDEVDIAGCGRVDDLVKTGLHLSTTRSNSPGGTVIRRYRRHFRCGGTGRRMLPTKWDET